MTITSPRLREIVQQSVEYVEPGAPTATANCKADQEEDEACGSVKCQIIIGFPVDFLTPIYGLGYLFWGG